MTVFTLAPLTADLLPAAVALDQCCLGGLWTLDGYRREMESPNSDLIVLCVEPSLGQADSGDSAKTAETAETAESMGGSEGESDSSAPRVIGLACVWAIVEEAHITLLAVHPDYRRLGLGRALIVALLTLARARHLEWATLEVRASNIGAIALYESYGFTLIGRRRRYYQDTNEDALILWCKGLHQPDFADTLERWGHQVRDRLSQHGGQIVVTRDLSPLASSPLTFVPSADDNHFSDRRK